MNAAPRKLNRNNTAAPGKKAKTARGERRWVVTGIALGLVIATLFFAPARWLAQAIEKASSGQVQLQSPQGSIWTGSAVLTLTGGEGSRDATTLPGLLHWKIRPHISRQWQGLALQLHPDCCASAPLQIQLQPGWRQATVRIADHQSQWPASLLQGLGAPWNTLQLDGTLRLALQNYALQWVQGRSLMQGSIEASLHNASSSLTTLRPMGSYRLIMQGSDTVGVRLVTDAGPLFLSGQGQWSGQRLRFNGEATAAPEHLPALTNLLSLLGRRDGPRAILSF